MEITTDAILKGPIWADALDKLKGTYFETYWDVFSLSIAIGMMYDSQIDSENMVPEDYDQEPKSVPRTMLLHAQNASLLEFMFQTALVTTKHLNLTEEERLELAFEKKKKPEFNPIAFLTKFANFGITKIYETISDTDDVETMESLMNFMNSTYEMGVKNTLQEEEIDDLEL